ncbi:MAG: penicillin-binding transpeptidase domain-containing protein [Chloroflexota bacterium]
MRRARVLLLGLLLAGCTFGGSRTPGPTATLRAPGVTSVSPPSPEAAVRQFLEAWKQGRYDDMYAMLTPLTRDSLTPEQFRQRYEDVQRAAALTGVDYEIVSSLMNPRAAQVAYRVTLHSAVVGDIVRDTTLDLTLVDGVWCMAWTEAAILPELKGGNGLYLDYVTPTRANIYDRNGLALAVQGEAVALWIQPNLIGDEDAESTMLSTLSRLLDWRPETIQALYEPFRNSDYYIPLGEVSLEEFQRYQGTLSAVGGVGWQVYSTRYYPFGGLAPQTVGYVSQIQQEELADYQARGYQGDEFVGREGLEAVYEDQLRGQPGGTLYLLNPNGQVIGSLASREPEMPRAVYATLDRNLQRYAQQALVGFNGAIVVLERDTGAVLAMVSSPGFDPNAYDTRNPNWQYLLPDIVTNPNSPTLNRATGSGNNGYPLGSVFKIITMSAALESGFYSPDTVYTCNGEFRELSGLVLYEWTVAKELPPHGEVTLVQGLERSCNPYFWHIGLDLFNRGLTTALPDMARAFGLGSPTGIEIGDWGGIVPDPDWKRENLGAEWGPGDAVQLAIGQASLNVTPLQVARFVAAVGNGGTLYRPQLVLRIQAAVGEATHEFQPEAQDTLPVSPENLATIRQAMVQVVRADRGTARRRFLGLDINVAGKTGTAESGAANPHAWFAGYTFERREDKPDIAVVVLVEYQGEGSDWAAPIFRRVVEAYFYGRPIALYPWESQIGVTRTPTPTPGPEGAAEPTATPAP